MIKKNPTYFLYLELIFLFIILPLLLAVPIPNFFKISLVIFGFVYVLIYLYKKTGFKISLPDKKFLPHFLKIVSLRLVPILIFGLIFVKIMAPEAFFRLVFEDIKLWLIIHIVYSFGSVLPQELIYRNFFFLRYRSLFKNKNIFLITNAFVFAISHAFLGSWVVIAITFIGGLMFALTFEKSKSTLLVSLEHAIYGLSLFTIGIGALLAFPS